MSFFFSLSIGQTSVSPSVQCADVGGVITFTCFAKAVPSRNFTWVRQETRETVNDGGRFSIISNTGSSQLSVRNVSIADGGYYTCDATMNSAQENKAVFYFQVPCNGKFIKCFYFALSLKSYGWYPDLFPPSLFTL